MSTLPALVAGLGLFFIGIRLIAGNLQQLAGGPIRKLLARALEHPVAAPIGGLLSGALTQSTSAATFVATSLVTAGALAMPSALVMLAAANVGTSVLVLLAAVDLRGLVFYVLAASGWSFFVGLDQAERHRHLVHAVLGLGLLLLGLSMIKSSAAVLDADPWVREFVEFAGTHPTAGFLAAFILAVATQSASMVSVLALPLLHQGLIDFDQSLMLVYGANAGSGFAVLMLASGMEGAARQLALCQVLLRMTAALLLVMAFAVEQSLALPGVAALLTPLAADPAVRMSLAFLLFQFVLAALAWLLRAPLLKLAAALSPTSVGDQLMKPSYLYDEAVEDPASALVLAEREVRGLVAQLPEYLDVLLPEDECRSPQIDVARRARANASVTQELQAFLGAILAESPRTAESQQVFEAKERALGLAALQQTLAEFTQDLASVPRDDRPAFAGHLVEGLHAILLFAEEARDAESLRLLHEMTGERGSLMDRVRGELTSGASSLAGREALLSATLRFERILWLLRQVLPLRVKDEPA
jgi:phosphate:Na+ symporter